MQCIVQWDLLISSCTGDLFLFYPLPILFISLWIFHASSSFNSWQRRHDENLFHMNYVVESGNKPYFLEERVLLWLLWTHACPQGIETRFRQVPARRDELVSEIGVKARGLDLDRLIAPDRDLPHHPTHTSDQIQCSMHNVLRHFFLVTS